MNNYNEFLKNVNLLFKNSLTKPIIKRIAIAGFSLIFAGSFIISEMARKTSLNSSFSAIRKIITRLLHLNIFTKIMEIDAKEMLKRPKNKKILISLDYTRLPVINKDVLFASLILDGRALPFYFEVLDGSIIEEKSKNIFEIEFVKKLLDFAPEDKSIVIIADRGFAKGRVIQRLVCIPRLYFVIRALSDTNVIFFKSGREVSLRNIKVKPGIPFHAKVLFSKWHKIPVNLTIFYKEGMKETWFLIDNLGRKDMALLIYNTRFSIEEGFKDIKNEIDLKEIRVHKNLRNETFLKLMVIWMISYCIIYALGVVNYSIIHLIIEKREGKKLLSFYFAGSRLLFLAIVGKLTLNWRGLSKVFELAGTLRKPKI